MKQPASADLLALVAIAALKYLPQVLGDLATAQGKARTTTPTVPPENWKQILLLRRMWNRFDAGHYQADELERGKLTALCDWLSDTAAVLSGSPAATRVQWADTGFVAKTVLPANAWEQIVEHVKEGRIG